MISSNADAAHDQTHSWHEFFQEAKERFTNAGFDNPSIDARRIVEEASGFEGAAFALGLRELATVRGVAKFDEMMQRRLDGEPLQYVIGRWGFRTLDLMVDERVLIPRPETESLVDVAMAHLQRLDGSASPLVVADLGCGSGAIGLSIAVETRGTEVWLTDVSVDAVSVARQNLTGIGRRATAVRVEQGNWFEALPSDLAGTFAVICSNPPYIADDESIEAVVAEYEPLMALRSGPSGTEAVEHLIDGAPEWLRSDGALVIEMAPQQLEPMADRARSNFVDVEVVNDLTGRPRILNASGLRR